MASDIMIKCLAIGRALPNTEVLQKRRDHISSITKKVSHTTMKIREDVLFIVLCSRAHLLGTAPSSENIFDQLSSLFSSPASARERVHELQLHHVVVQALSLQSPSRFYQNDAVRKSLQALIYIGRVYGLHLLKNAAATQAATIHEDVFGE